MSLLFYRFGDFGKRANQRLLPDAETGQEYRRGVISLSLAAMLLVAGVASTWSGANSGSHVMMGFGIVFLMFSVLLAVPGTLWVMLFDDNRRRQPPLQGLATSPSPMPLDIWPDLCKGRDVSTTADSIKAIQGASDTGSVNPNKALADGYALPVSAATPAGEIKSTTSTTNTPSSQNPLTNDSESTDPTSGATSYAAASGYAPAPWSSSQLPRANLSWSPGMTAGGGGPSHRAADRPYVTLSEAAVTGAASRPTTSDSHPAAARQCASSPAQINVQPRQQQQERSRQCDQPPSCK